jgi:four helix bundle protein
MNTVLLFKLNLTTTKQTRKPLKKRNTYDLQDFEDLPVWQEAAKLYEMTDDFLVTVPSRLRYSFRNQLERAVLSISNNIAEGFERGTSKELLQFIYTTRGSAGEARSMLSLLRRRAWARELDSEIAKLRDTAMNCSRQLRGWAESLQNSAIEGLRHLNERTRRIFEQKQRADALQKRLLTNLLPDHPLRKKEEDRGKE